MKLKPPIGTVRANEQRLGLVPAFASTKYSVDTSTKLATGSRVDDYWSQHKFTPLYKGFSKTGRAITAELV